MHDASDTIAAIATPPGPGGIAVLRISGPQAARVLSSLFCPSACTGPSDAFTYKPRFLHHGQVLDAQGRRLDEALAVFMPGPRSFTGEDVAEIHCHGGRGVTAALLEAALRAGARGAAPGEFTRRAFLNGRLDLTQAEAVAEMISAPTREGARLASAKLDGLLSREITAVRDALDALRAQAILAVDFPDEEAELLPRQAFGRTLRDCSAAVRRLVSAFERARLWREGASAVLAGRVNTGKSSLLNALLGRERAIVSARPGTTRDYIEESINLSGLPLRLVDTAGLRGGGDVDGTEREGMRRSGDLAEEADLLIFVSDVTAPPHPDETDFLRRHWARLNSGSLLLIINKIDLLTDDDAGRAARVLEKARALLSAAAPPGICAQDMAKAYEECPVLGLSAKTGSGLELLAKGMGEALRALEGKAESGETAVAPNLRQSLLLRETLDEFDDLEAALAAGLPPDILAVHLETAAQKLDEVTGSSCTEELLDRIFASFCIGK